MNGNDIRQRLTAALAGFPKRPPLEAAVEFFASLRYHSQRRIESPSLVAAVDRQIATFRVADLQAQYPGVGLDLIRQILARLQKEKRIKSLGTGRSAKWHKIIN